MTMRNDATRLLIATRDKRRARAVVARQGQVLLDTDLDQQARHQIERIEIETVDSLGSPERLLVPAGNTGFQITAGGTLATFNLGSGRGYLDGGLLENPSVCTLATQPHPRTGDTVALPSVVAVKSLVRFIDPVEEPALADVALGDAQASGQSLNDWQVFPLNLTGTPSCATVLSTAQWQNLTAPSTGTLKVIEQAAAPSTDPCSLTPAGGYTRYENLLYRIEVHAGDVNTTFPSVDGPRFSLHNLKVKLSRRNASVLVRITGISGVELTVAPASLDSRNWFAPGLHAEIVSLHDDVDPRAALANDRLFRVALASDDKVTLEATTAQVTNIGIANDGSWFLRLWDAFPANGGGVAVVSAPGAATESVAIDLGDGLTIKLGTGGSTSGTFRRGDYWTFPARANGSVDWPKTGGAPDAVRPHGPAVRYAPLAVINPPSSTPAFEDCRMPFATLSDRSLLYRGGDGQGVFSPAATGMVQLPAKFRVAVMRGATPAVGVPIRWSFVEPAGGSCLIGGATCHAGNSPETLTDANGLAEVTCAIDASRRLDVHKVQAAIALGPGLASQPPLVFSAVFETAAHTSYEGGKCADLAGATNVQDALDILCARSHGTGCCIAVGKGGEYPTLDAALQDLLKKGERDICICLLPGEHGLKSDIDVKLPGVRLLVHGAGRGSRLDLVGHSLSFGELAALAFRDFDIADSSGKKSVVIEMCDDVVVSGMRISGLTRGRLSALHIGRASRIELTSSTVLAYSEEGIKHGITLLGLVPALNDFADSAFALKGLFAEVDRKVVEALAGMAASARKQSIDAITKVTQGPAGPKLTADEQNAFGVLSRELADPKSRRFAQPLERLRQALLLSQAGHAVAVGDGDAIMLVADNLIGGRLSVYGEATTPNPALDDAALKILGPAIKKGDIVLRPGTGDLRLRNNRLREVRVGDEMMAAVVTAVKNTKGPVDGVLASLIGDANVLAGPRSEMIAFDAALSQNVLKPERDDVAAVAATQAKYLGNLAHNDFRVFNVGNAAEKFGNGSLSIIDL